MVKMAESFLLFGAEKGNKYCQTQTTANIDRCHWCNLAGNTSHSPVCRIKGLRNNWADGRVREGIRGF